MTRRSSVTSRRGCITVAMVLLLPIPLVVVRFFTDIKRTYESEVYITIMTLMLLCFITTAFAYFNVYRIILHHQQLANQSSQNFGQPAINLTKYKISVILILYILLLFSVCFLPFVIYISLLLPLGNRPELGIAFNVSMLLLFLSSSLNPGLYVWRMNNIRNGVKQLF